MKMSSWPEISQYSKKSVFLSIPSDIETLTWADQVIHRLGGVKGVNEGERGWILPKSQEINFHSQYKLFKETHSIISNKRRSRNPEKKHKRSRVFVRESEQKSGSSSQLDDSKDETEKRLSGLKPVSYINWETPNDVKDDSLSDDEKKRSRSRNRDESDDENRSGSDDESSDDELIRAVLARKMKSESSGKSIESETINDSDEEDCVSYSRRLRHIYSVIETLRTRISELEKKGQSPAP